MADIKPDKQWSGIEKDVAGWVKDPDGGVVVIRRAKDTTDGKRTMCEMRC